MPGDRMRSTVLLLVLTLSMFLSACRRTSDNGDDTLTVLYDADERLFGPVCNCDGIVNLIRFVPSRTSRPKGKRPNSGDVLTHETRFSPLISLKLTIPSRTIQRRRSDCWSESVGSIGTATASVSGKVWRRGSRCWLITPAC
jgi:hypothetical protein